MSSLNPGLFTFSRSAIQIIEESIGDREAARAALFEDLKVGFIRAIGYSAISPHSLLVRRAKNGQLQYVPQRFWSEAAAGDFKEANWISGRFSRSDPGAEFLGPSAWDDVRFETSLLHDIGKKRSTRGRKRTPAWNDWVAAVAIIASDGKLRSNLTETQFLKLVADQMAEWGIEEMSRSTVQNAAGAVIRAVRKAGH